mgnify:CR=1 FL=1
MSVELILEDPRWRDVPLDPIGDQVTGILSEQLNLPPLTVAILACDDTRIAALNAEFRGKEMPTNVLSWPSDDLASGVTGKPPHPPTDTEIGDIAIAFDTCAREAAEQGKTLTDHTTHLIVHGILHLLGYDHIDDADGDLMEATETAILLRLGLADPYGTDQA